MGARLDQTLRPWAALWAQVVVYWTLAWLVLRYRGRALYSRQLSVVRPNEGGAGTQDDLTSCGGGAAVDLPVRQLLT